MADNLQQAWDDLKKELDRFADMGSFVSLWWRDDDAIGDSSLLQKLFAYRAPLILAVIPALTQSGFAVPPGVKIAQHGYDHRNRASEGQKKSEFPEERSIAEMVEALERGREYLTATFTDAFLPLFVPPWNRFQHPSSVWQKSGLKKISTFKDYRKDPSKADPAFTDNQINTNIDLINWRERVFAGEEAVLEGLCAHLRAKRLNQCPMDEPTGFLTHHLVHDKATWSFLDKWTKFLEDNKHSIGWRAIEVL